MLIITVLLVIIVFLQSALLMANIVLPFVLAISLKRIDNRSLLVIFLAGILNDILTLQTIGSSSLLFLLMTLLLYWYRRKYKIRNLVTALVIFLLTMVPYHFLVNKNINFGIIMFEMLAFTFFYYLFSVFLKEHKLIYD